MPASLEDQLADIFADFRDFAGLLEIATKKGGRVPFNWGRWHAEQKQFERERTGRDIVLKPRQIGFSTLELARDLWFAVTQRGVKVLVVGHDKKLAEDLFARTRAAKTTRARPSMARQAPTAASSRRRAAAAAAWSALRRGSPSGACSRSWWCSRSRGGHEAEPDGASRSTARPGARQEESSALRPEDGPEAPGL